MGHETVGRIDELGSGVTGLTPGQLVTVNPVMGCNDCAGLRERSGAVVQPQGGARGGPGDLGGVRRAGRGAGGEHRDSAGGDAGRAGGPGGADWPWAITPFAAATATEGDRVLVIGGGPIGQACLLAARRLGIDNLAISDVSPSRRELCAGLGAQAIDPTAGDLAECGHRDVGWSRHPGGRRGGHHPDGRRRPGRFGPRRPDRAGRHGFAAAGPGGVRDQHGGAEPGRLVHLQPGRVRRDRRLGGHRPGRDRVVDRRPGRLGGGAAEFRRPRPGPQHGEQDPGLPAGTRGAAPSEHAAHRPRPRLHRRRGRGSGLPRPAGLPLDRRPHLHPDVALSGLRREPPQLRHQRARHPGGRGRGR